MSESAPRKQEEDFSDRVDAVLPEVKKLVEDEKLQDAIDKLLALEKQTRNASDLSSTTRIILEIETILYSKGRLDLLNIQISALARKHGQLRQAVQKLVEQAMTHLDELKGNDRLTLINTLREVSEGKIYLEVPRARLTRMLSKIKEDEGDSAGASELLQEVQVETFGSMERREKVDFILEQMRLLRIRSDWDRLGIVSKKINIKWLCEKDNEDLKLRFYSLMILFALHRAKYLDLCKYYRSVYDTPSIQSDQSKWSAALRNAVFFVILAPHDNEQSDLLERISREENLPEIQNCYNLVQCFTTPELMRWPGIQELYGPLLRSTKVFGTTKTVGVVGDIDEDVQEGEGEVRWEELHTRVIEHNVRVIAKYYTRITLDRLATLLDLDATKTESILSRLVVQKMVYARIDRPAGTINFSEPKGTDRILNDWSSDVGKLMGLIEKTCHLISKEHAIHQARLSAAKA